MKGWTDQEIMRDMIIPALGNVPVFTYVADGVGTCAKCHQSFHEGATVVRVGVTCCDVGFGWQQYHLGCYTMLVNPSCT